MICIHIPGVINPSDALTKPLGSTLHREQISLLHERSTSLTAPLPLYVLSSLHWIQVRGIRALTAGSESADLHLVLVTQAHTNKAEYASETHSTVDRHDDFVEQHISVSEYAADKMKLELNFTSLED